MPTSRAMMHTLRSSPEGSCASRCAAHLPQQQQACFGNVYGSGNHCSASGNVAYVAPSQQPQLRTHLTASSPRHLRTFFWSALFTRLAVPTYSHCSPEGAPLPGPSPASAAGHGAMSVTSLSATCAHDRLLVRTAT